MSAAQNEISGGVLGGSDLVQREEDVLKDASKKLNFVPNTLIGRSRWWGSQEAGAFHYAGTYQDKPAVIKIQGIKPRTSEIYMIQEFTKSNRSNLVRPPHLFAYLEWDDALRYEALVLEHIEGKRIVNMPTNSKEISEYYRIYADYRKNCLSHPWVSKPNVAITSQIAGTFTKWMEISKKIYPNHPLVKPGDQTLITQAVGTLTKGYEGVELEFVHGHLSDGDFYSVDNQVVVLSNLYWGWRTPFYDAIFAYHWYRYHLNDFSQATPAIVSEQKQLWLDHILKLPQNNHETRLLKLALLERAAAGLNLDGLSANPDNPITAYLLDDTREELQKLLEELS